MSWLDANRRSPKLDVLVELGRRQDHTYSRAELDAGLELVTARLETTRRRRAQLRRAAPLVSVLLLGVCVLLVARRWLVEPPSLTYEVRGGAILDAGYLRETGGKGVELQFEEGTRFSLASGARARLRSVDANGARLGLESGAASFDVVPDTSRRWEVEVGPFLVKVKGTVFDVAWDPVVEEFRLDLERGKVLVSGPVSGGELTLLSGQRLMVNLGRGETQILDSRRPPESRSGGRDAGDAPRGTPAPPDVGATEDQHAAPTATSPAPVAAGLAPEGSRAKTHAAELAPGHSGKSTNGWSSALAKGRWDEILSDAQTLGISHVLTTASSEDLFTLATAARYRQRSSLARETLLALRQRFPSSSRSRDAAFLLGRVAESLGETQSADGWYRDYLARAPKGAYASEALGRRMTLSSRISGPGAARPYAEEYLRRFPNGSYAGAARVLLEGH